MKTLNMTYGLTTGTTPCHMHMGTCGCGRPMHMSDGLEFLIML